MHQQHQRGVIRRLVSLLITLSLGLLGVMASAGVASATVGTNDYPYAGYSGPGTNPAGSYWTDSSGNAVSPYGYYYRNCTDFVAWRLHNDNGFAFPGGIGNGAAWGTWAQSHGYTVDTTPAAGAVAWWAANTLDNGYNVGSFGHVAYVDGVNANGSVNIEEYNWVVNGTPDGAYHTRTITASGTEQVEYIHFPVNNVLPSNTFQTAFQAAGSHFYTYDSTNGKFDTGQGMAVGTSPAIANISGGHEEAFQANNGYLYIWGTAASGNTQLGMTAGTSPSIAALASGGYEVAFQAAGGHLWVYGSAGTFDTGLGMAVGTSPAIAASPSGGFVIAFQAASGHLYTYDTTNGGADTQQGMAVGTSPAIVGLAYGGGYEEAFQANTGNLFVWGDSGRFDTGLGMSSSTSPNIATSPGGGFRIAFQAASGHLYTYDTTNGGADTQQGMAVGTSPAIVGLAYGGGYEEAFQANTGNLFVWGEDGKFDTGQGMAVGTSPAIAR